MLAIASQKANVVWGINLKQNLLGQKEKKKNKNAKKRNISEHIKSKEYIDDHICSIQEQEALESGEESKSNKKSVYLMDPFEN